MRTPDNNYVSEVIYNPETDMYELYSFGVRVRRSPDEAVVDRTAYYLEKAFRRGRDDVLTVLNNGEVSLEQLNETSEMMRSIRASQAYDAPEPVEDVLFGEQPKHYDILHDIIRPDLKDLKGF